MYFVYILKSLKDGSNYIGITTDLKKRIQEHNTGGYKFTTAKQPYKIIWYSVFKERVKAHRFEKYLKSGSGIAFSKKHLI